MLNIGFTAAQRRVSRTRASKSRYSSSMPIGAQDHLEGLYGRQRLLSEEASRLESERDLLLGKNSDRRYILEVEIVALREEASRISARIADVLERDLQR
jgi:hypothetical protein